MKKSFGQSGFVPVTIIFLIVAAIVIFIVLANPKSKTTNDINTQNTPIPTPSIQPTKVPVATPSAYQSISNDNCIITSNAERIHPPAYFYFTLTLEKGNINSIRSVQWDNGNGVIDISQTSTTYGYTYKDFGNYTVRARAKLADGTVTNWCSKRAEAQIFDLKCQIFPSPSSGKAPLAASLNSGVFSDPSDGDMVGYQWDFNGDGNWDTSFNDANKAPTYTYQEPKTYTVRLQVKASSGRISDICTSSITPN